MDARSPNGATGYQTVRLSQVPQKKRLEVAHRIIRLEGIVGVPALELMMAATEPRQDPSIVVDAELARRVLGRSLS